MKLGEKVKNWLNLNESVTVTNYKMLVDRGGGFYSYNGKVYQSDIVRACIRQKAKAVGKAVGKHVRKTDGKITINPDPYIRFLLEEPNPYMTGQLLQEKMTIQLMLNNNAFAYIQRDENDLPVAIYPIIATEVDAIQDKSYNLYLKFRNENGKSYTFDYRDIIHLRRDFYSNELFGEDTSGVLTPLMKVVQTTDQGIVNAIKNSSVIRWLLKYHTTMRPEDLKKQTDEFVNSFLKIEGSGDGNSTGAAATDAKFDAEQVDPKDYVPNASLVDRTTDRIYSFFNTNKEIVQSSYDENKWISYYEAEVEPDLAQLSGEYTRKIFSRKARGFGNQIIFESSNLTFASMSTKLQLVQFVDRGAMSINELREVINLAPREGGDEFIRRLDTRPVEE